MATSIAYESLLEMRFLRTVDFGGVARTIRSQPFQLRARFSDKMKRYTPDFLVVDRDNSITIVEVKSAESMERTETRAVLTWASQLCRSRGWNYVVWCGAPPAVEANLRYLASARNPFRVSRYALSAISDVADGRTIAQVLEELHGLIPSTSILPHLSHLMWTGEVGFDLSVLIQESTRLVVRS